MRKIYSLVLAFGITLGYNSPSFAAKDDPSKPDGICHEVSDLIPDLVKPYQGEAVVYPFEGVDAEQIRTSFDKITGGSHEPWTDVQVVLWLDDNAVTFYTYGSDKCFASKISMDVGTASDILNDSGVTPPFGKTYHQLPGVPPGNGVKI